MRRVTTVGNDGLCGVASRWSLDLARGERSECGVASRWSLDLARGGRSSDQFTTSPVSSFGSRINQQSDHIAKHSTVGHTVTHTGPAAIVHDQTNPFGQRFSLMKDNPLYTSDEEEESESSPGDERTPNNNGELMKVLDSNDVGLFVTCCNSSVPNTNKISFEKHFASKNELSLYDKDYSETGENLSCRETKDELITVNHGVSMACGITPRVFKSDINSHIKSTSSDVSMNLKTVNRVKPIVASKPIVKKKPNIPNKLKLNGASEDKLAKQILPLELDMPGLNHQISEHLLSSQNLAEEFAVIKEDYVLNDVEKQPQRLEEPRSNSNDGFNNEIEDIVSTEDHTDCDDSGVDTHSLNDLSRDSSLSRSSNSILSSSSQSATDDLLHKNIPGSEVSYETLDNIPRLVVSNDTSESIRQPGLLYETSVNINGRVLSYETAPSDGPVSSHPGNLVMRRSVRVERFESTTFVDHTTGVSDNNEKNRDNDPGIDPDLLNVDVMTESVDVILRDDSEACVTVKLLSERTVPVKPSCLQTVVQTKHVQSTNTTKNQSVLINTTSMQDRNADKLGCSVNDSQLNSVGHVTSYKKSSVLVSRTTQLNLCATAAGRQLLERLKAATGQQRWSCLGEELDQNFTGSSCLLSALRDLAESGV